MALYTSIFLYPEYLFRDQWVYYPSFMDAGISDLLLVSVNQHRVVVPGFFIWLDIHWFSANNMLIMVIGLLAMLSYSTVFIVGSSRNLLSILLPVIFLFWLGNYTFGRPLFAVTENMMLLFVLLSIWVVQQKHYLLAAFFAFCASFSFSLGVLAWPVLAFMLLADNRRLAIVYILSGLLVLFLYVFLPGGSSVQSQLMLKPIQQFIFILSYMGSVPVFMLDGISLQDRSRELIAVCAGLVACVSFLWVCWSVKKQEANTSQKFLAGIMFFSLLSAVLTALGRADFDPVSVRFVNFVVLFWLGLALFILHRCSFSKSLLLVFPVTILVVVSQAGFAAKAEQEKWKADKASLSMELGIPTRRDAKELVGWPYNTEPVSFLVNKLPENKAYSFSIEDVELAVCTIKGFDLIKIPDNEYLTKSDGDAYFQAWFSIASEKIPPGDFALYQGNEPIGLGKIRKRMFYQYQMPKSATAITWQEIKPDSNLYLYSREYFCELSNK